MTALADLAVAETYRSVASELAAVHGVPRDNHRPAQEMLIVGMGKLGGCELNVSSDIDLIMLYGEEGETDGPRRISHHEFYGRLTRRMMPVLSEVDANGQVFRTDLRLRPDGDAGPLAWSLDALEHYLIGQGREWERYAWLKARLMPARAFEGSDSALQARQLKACACPSCTASISTSTRWPRCALRERIRQDWQRRASARNGIDSANNIKLGDGGIREIEFVVQLAQLIRGGRMPALQRRACSKRCTPKAPPACCPKPTRSGWSRLPLPAPHRARAAVPRRRADPPAARRPRPARRAGGGAGHAGRRIRGHAGRAPRLRLADFPQRVPPGRHGRRRGAAPAADAADKEEPDEQCELAGQIRQPSATRPTTCCGAPTP